ncbi:hypothetical protein ACFPN7_41505 [Amycolatopsis halotolerans]
MADPRSLTSSFDPDAAAHSAKNAPAAPGPADQPHDRSERNTMVGTAAAFVTDAYKAIADLMAARPISAVNYATGREFDAAQVTWLFAMADALEDADLCEDADTTRETALSVVREAVSQVAGVVA